MGMIGRSLIGLGALIALVGLALVLRDRFGLIRLPGDIYYRRNGLTVYFPIVSCLLASAILTLVLNLIFRRR